MVVKFGKLNQFERPLMTLCNPGAIFDGLIISKAHGILTDHEAEEISFNFNALSELSMRVNKVEHDDIAENENVSDLYYKIQNRKLIFFEGVGFFVITNVTDSFDGGKYYKDVEAKSVDCEFKNRNIPYIADGTYSFYTMLNTILEKFPLWHIERIDEEVLTRSRTFESVEIKTTCYDFMMDSMQKMYECFFVFDIMNRGVIVYDKNTYKDLPDVMTNIYLSKKDIVNVAKTDENADELYTALNVYSSTNVGIADVNPIGTSCIYNFDYYIPWMSSGLQNSIAEWKDAVSEHEREYQELCRMKEMNEINISFTQSKIDQIDLLIEYYEKCKKNALTLSNDASFEVIANSSANIDSYKESQIFATGYKNGNVFYENRIEDNNSGEYTYSSRIEEYDGRYYKDITDKNEPKIYLCTKVLTFNDGCDQSEDSAVFWGRYNSDTGSFYAGVAGEYFAVETDNVIVMDITTSTNYIGEFDTIFEEVENYYDTDAVIVYGYYSSPNFYKQKIHNEIDDQDHYYRQITPVSGCFYCDMRSNSNYVMYRYDGQSGSFIAVTEKQFIIDRFDLLINACEDKRYELDGLLYPHHENETGMIAKRATYDWAINHIVDGYMDNGVRHNGVSLFAGNYSYFSSDEYDELKNYIFETDYSDEDIIITDSMTVWDQFKQKKQLLDNGRNKLKDISVPTVKIEVDTESFIFDSKFKQWSEQIETGKLIEVDLASSTARPLLTNITINYDDHKIKMGFSSDYNKYDTLTLYNNLFKKARKSDKITSYLASAITAFSAKASNTGQDVARFYLS